MSYNPLPGESDPEYWNRMRLEKGAGIVSEHHSDKKKTVKYGQTEEAHHEVRFTDRMDGTTLLVKIFSDDRMAFSMNGPFNISAADLQHITEITTTCLSGCTAMKGKS